MVPFVWFKMMVALPLHALDIGEISELKGNAQVVRDKPYVAELKFGIEQNDNVQNCKILRSGNFKSKHLKLLCLIHK